MRRVVRRHRRHCRRRRRRRRCRRFHPSHLLRLGWRKKTSIEFRVCIEFMLDTTKPFVCLFVCLCPVLTKTRSKVQLLLLGICQRPAEAEAERISINLVLCCSSAWIEFWEAAKKKTLSVHFFILLWFKLRYEKCKFNYLVLDSWFRGLGTSKQKTLDIFATNLVHQRLKQFRNL